MVTDTIGDFLTRIRNAQIRNRESTLVPASKILLNIAEILKKEGFINDFEQEEVEGKIQKHLKIHLRYIKDKPAITGIQRVSKPGVRMYTGYRNIENVLNGMGMTILTTPKGIITGKEARKLKVGGEVLCKVW